MNPLVQNFIKQTITLLLSKLKICFPNGELAYYSLQGKNELQIRDKIAWELQKALDTWKNARNQYIVRREWGSFDNKKCDLAVLEVDTTNTNKSELVALFEFKAHAYVNTKEDWPYASFYADVRKMRDTIYTATTNGKQAKDADMYFIFLQSSQNQNHIIGGYEDAVAYKDRLINPHTIFISHPTFMKRVIAFWNDFLNNSVIHNALHTKTGAIKKHFCSVPSGAACTILYNKIKFVPPVPYFQNVGAFLGYDWYVAPMIWGPYKTTDITLL